MKALCPCSLLGIAAAILLLPTPSFSQSADGALAGTVTDQSGASVEGAKITLKSEDTGTTLDATAGAGGDFRFPSLRVGKYDISASQKGFSSVAQTGVEVQINSTATVALTLNVGESTQTVTVQADATRVNTETSDIGTVISTQQIVELPLALGGVGAMRSPEAFVFLAPGTSGPGTANSNNGIFISKIGGGQNFGNELLLDGASTLRSENGSSFDEAGPSVEAIQEFKVLTSTFPAIYGRTTGGIESFTIKSGTNTFHGTAYDIFQNEDLNANSWFNNGFAASKCAPNDAACLAPYRRPLDKKNDYGVNLGGPVFIPKIFNGKNKTFFFFNWEQYRQNNGGVSNSTVPTLAQRGGDFSSSLGSALPGQTNPCTGGPVLAGQIFDPATTAVGSNGSLCRSPFPGNQIPLNRLDPLALKLLNFFPTPNTSLLNNGNYVLAYSYPIANTTYTIKIDENLSDKSRFFGMYDSRQNTRLAGTPYYPGIVDGGAPTQDFITHYGRMGWDYIFSPTLLNHLNGGWNRTNSINISAAVAAGNGTNYGTQLGIPNTAGLQFPVVNIAEGVPTLGVTRNNDIIDNGIRINDYVSWSLGRHSLTLGVDFRNQLFSNINRDNDTGTFGFNRNSTAVTETLNGQTGNGIASFLLGTVDNASRALPAHFALWNSQYAAAFVQDDWKVTSHLTLNLGVRWDVDVPRKESKDNTSNYSLSAPNPGAGGRPGAMVFGDTCKPGCDPRWAKTYYKDFAPRVGFAWSPAGEKFVVRGGYGMYYSPLQYTDFGGEQVQGYTATPNFSSPNNFTPAFNLQQGFPSFAPAPNRNPSLFNGQPHADYIDPSYGKPGVIQSWSLQLQQQVSKNMVATLGYVGQRSTHLRSSLLNLNNINPSQFALGDLLSQPLTGNTGGVTAPYANFVSDFGSSVNVAQAIRPFPQNKYLYTDVLQNVGQASYHSLQATLERRFSTGFSLQASFTWAKIITDADSILPGINGGVSQIQNPYNLRDEKALSSQDVPYTFATAPLYELPFGKGKPFLRSGIAGAVLGGWQVGAVLRYQSGVPVSFGCANSIPGWDNCIRFNRVGSLSPLSTSVLNGTFSPFVTGNTYYNPNAFADPNANRAARGGTYQFGNYPRNDGSVRTPNYYNEDISIIRNFHFTESAFIQAKGELLNATNRHILSVPNSGDNASPNNPNFGVVNGTVDNQRVVQFTLRLNF